MWNSQTSAAYCWYNNDQVTYKTDYGALYNWYAAYNDKLCPTGWHVPSLDEWNILINYLGGLMREANLKNMGQTIGSLQIPELRMNRVLRHFQVERVLHGLTVHHSGA